jgi:hypothetical protein
MIEDTDENVVSSCRPRQDYSCQNVALVPQRTLAAVVLLLSVLPDLSVFCCR